MSQKQVSQSDEIKPKNSDETNHLLQQQQALETWIRMLDWQRANIERSPIPNAVSQLQIACLMAEADPANVYQLAPMMNSLALAQSNTASQEVLPHRPKAARPILQAENLPTRLSKRSSADLEEAGRNEGGHKKSRSQNNLEGMGEMHASPSEQPQSPHPRLSHNESRLPPISERDMDNDQQEDRQFSGGMDQREKADDGLQDDTEVKKMRRKQSNRESARRSRLRKQRESEALSSSIEDLRQENQQLRDVNKALLVKVNELTKRLAEVSSEKDNTLASPQENKFQAIQKNAGGVADARPFKHLGLKT